MSKSQKKRVWTPEEKLEIIKNLEDHISLRTLEKEINIERSVIKLLGKGIHRRWCNGNTARSPIRKQGCTFTC